MSNYKSLLTQACVALMSFIFPMQWQHTLIPILPAAMIDVVDAPLPYLIGVEADVLAECYPDCQFDGCLKIDLDKGTMSGLVDNLNVPKTELLRLRDKLELAT